MSSVTQMATRPGEAAAASSPSAPSRRRKLNLTRKVADNIAGFVFLIPWIIGMVVLVLGPFVTSLYLSFTNYDLFTKSDWIGLQNYIDLFTKDSKFIKSLIVTFTYVLVSVPLRLIVALALAVLLNRKMRGLTFYRSVFYLPSMLGGSVGIAVLWRQVFGGDGIINQILAFLGIDGPNWIADPKYALMTIIALAIWQFGSPMVIFLAALRNVPKELEEAAAIDGADKTRTFFSVVLPCSTPIVFFNLVMQMITAFQAFTPSYIISGGTGGPVNSTLFYSLYLYQQAFSYFKMGYASAMAWILVGVIGVFTAIIFVSSKKWVFYGDE